MSDKDCVSRKAVLALLNATSKDEMDEECYHRLCVAVANMDAVPHEMTARELFSTRDRMCNDNYNGGHITPACKTCPLWRDNNGYDMYCGSLMASRPLAFVEIVEAWAREHPERSEE